MLNYGGEQNMTLLVLLVWKTTFFLVWKSPQIPRVDVSDSNWRKSIEFKEWRNQGYLSTLCGKLIHITPLLDISGLTLKERYATTLRETFWSGKVLSLVAPFIDFIALFFDLANSDWWTNHPFPTLFPRSSCYKRETGFQAWKRQFLLIGSSAEKTERNGRYRALSRSIIRHI